MIEKSLNNINFKKLCSGSFFPSPAAWEDQVLYFMMLDRFSDCKENDYFDNNGQKVTNGSTPLFNPGDKGNAGLNSHDKQKWFEAGSAFAGGNLKGLKSKIGYLKRLGITAIWISPIFKQVAFKETYHGYGIQNFIDVDPHFGTREDLRKLVETAHDHDIRIILDIILNHSGDVFDYDADRYEHYTDQGEKYNDPRWDGNHYTVKGFRDKEGTPSISFYNSDPALDTGTWPDGAIWPCEFQNPAAFTRKGYINSWDYYPEFIEGDFFDLKDIYLGHGSADDFHPSSALNNLCEVYKFWIAFADIDGYRIDTVKHMDTGATRYFTSVIHEFAQYLGKENFYLIGEITGGRQRAFSTLEETGLNAALGINDIPDKIEYLVKGYRNPEEYFDLFRNSLLIKKDSHVWFKNKVVTTFDDHDQVRKGNYKARFCFNESPTLDSKKMILNALALTTLTLGIPCIYYGTEQYFDGHGDNDRYLREAMFGGKFGAFESKERHFFNEDTYLYRELSKILAIRKDKIALRRGRQYLRSISGNGIDFGFPQKKGNEIRSVVPWSRIFNNREILLAINTDADKAKSAWVTIDNNIHEKGKTLSCIYATDEALIDNEITVEARNGKSVYLTVPPAGFVMYE